MIRSFIHSYIIVSFMILRVVFFTPVLQKYTHTLRHFKVFKSTMKKTQINSNKHQWTCYFHYEKQISSLIGLHICFYMYVFTGIVQRLFQGLNMCILMNFQYKHERHIVVQDISHSYSTCSY